MSISSSVLPPIGCAYPLNDDGSVAASFGFGYAGPAVGADMQTMQFVTTGIGGTKLLMSSDPLGAASYGLPTVNPCAFEAVCTSANILAGSNGLAILWHNAGSLVNAGTIPSIADGDLLAFIVAPDGAVSAERNGVPRSIGWLFPTPTIIAAGDKFAPYLYTNDTLAGQLSEVSLRTYAADMTGTYTAGTTDPCGNVI